MLTIILIAQINEGNKIYLKANKKYEKEEEIKGKSITNIFRTPLEFIWKTIIKVFNSRISDAKERAKRARK